MILPATIVAGVAFRFVPALRDSAGAIRSKRIVLGALSIAAFAVAAYDNVSVESDQYPALADAYFKATPGERVAMDGVIRAAAPRRELFSFSLAQRDRYLEAGGFCTWRSFGDCKPLPPGTQPIGLAINNFPYGDRARSELPCNGPCREEMPAARSPIDRTRLATPQASR